MVYIPRTRSWAEINQNRIADNAYQVVSRRNDPDRALDGGSELQMLAYELIELTQARRLGFTDYVGGEERTVGGVKWQDDGNNRCSLLDYNNTHEGQVHVTLLIPDQDRPQREDFVWALAVDRPAWQKWYTLAEKFKGFIPKEHSGGTHAMRYMHRFDKGKVKTILVLPNGSQDDDAVKTACAWLRLIKEYDCKIYVLRCTDDPLRGPRLMERVMGVDPTLVEEVPEDEPRGTNDAGQPA